LPGWLDLLHVFAVFSLKPRHPLLVLLVQLVKLLIIHFTDCTPLVALADRFGLEVDADLLMLQLGHAGRRINNLHDPRVWVLLSFRGKLLQALHTGLEAGDQLLAELLLLSLGGLRTGQRWRYLEPGTLARLRLREQPKGLLTRCLWLLHGKILLLELIFRIRDRPKISKSTYDMGWGAC
jgi:hypothetical protein